MKAFREMDYANPSYLRNQDARRSFASDSFRKPLPLHERGHWLTKLLLILLGTAILGGLWWLVGMWVGIF
jgi:hypothetical protein